METPASCCSSSPSFLPPLSPSSISSPVEPASSASIEAMANSNPSLYGYAHSNSFYCAFPGSIDHMKSSGGLIGVAPSPSCANNDIGRSIPSDSPNSTRIKPDDEIQIISHLGCMSSRETRKGKFDLSEAQSIGESLLVNQSPLEIMEDDQNLLSESKKISTLDINLMSNFTRKGCIADSLDIPDEDVFGEEHIFYNTNNKLGDLNCLWKDNNFQILPQKGFSQDKFSGGNSPNTPLSFHSNVFPLSEMSYNNQTVNPQEVFFNCNSVPSSTDPEADSFSRAGQNSGFESFFIDFDQTQRQFQDFRMASASVSVMNHERKQERVRKDSIFSSNVSSSPKSREPDDIYKEQSDICGRSECTVADPSGIFAQKSASPSSCSFGLPPQCVPKNAVRWRSNQPSALGLIISPITRPMSSSSEASPVGIGEERYEPCPLALSQPSTSLPTSTYGEVLKNSAGFIAPSSMSFCSGSLPGPTSGLEKKSLGVEYDQFSTSSDEEGSSSESIGLSRNLNDSNSPKIFDHSETVKPSHSSSKIFSEGHSSSIDGWSGVHYQNQDSIGKQIQSISSPFCASYQSFEGTNSAPIGPGTTSAPLEQVQLVITASPFLHDSLENSKSNFDNSIMAPIGRETRNLNDYSRCGSVNHNTGNGILKEENNALSLNNGLIINFLPEHNELKQGSNLQKRAYKRRKATSILHPEDERGNKLKVKLRIEESAGPEKQHVKPPTLKNKPKIQKRYNCKLKRQVQKNLVFGPREKSTPELSSVTQEEICIKEPSNDRKLVSISSEYTLTRKLRKKTAKVQGRPKLLIVSSDDNIVNELKETKKSKQSNHCRTSSSASKSEASLARCSYVNQITGQRCGTVFKRTYDLARHKETIHSKDNPNNDSKPKWNCKFCGIEFSRKDSLIRHCRMRKHSTKSD